MAPKRPRVDQTIVAPERKVAARSENDGKEPEQAARPAGVESPEALPLGNASASSSSAPVAGVQIPASVGQPPCFDAGSVADAPAKPTLPDSREDSDVDVRKLMRSIIAYVRYHLKQHLKDNPSYFSAFADVELHEHPPLSIKQGTDMDLLSYKAPWNADLAATSLGSTNKYEAGGNIFWINPFPDSPEGETLAGDTNSWAHVTSMADALRAPGGASTPSGGTVAKEKRLTFSVVFTVWAPNMAFYHNRASFPGTMNLVAGHVALWGWYVAVFDALCAGQTQLLALLWQAALTATIQGNIVKERSSLAVLSMGMSNSFFVTAKSLADSFPAFARKLQVALSGTLTSGANAAKRLEFCKNMGIRYNGGEVHRTLMIAATKYVELVDERTHAYLMALERKFGKDVLSGKWNNLNKVLQACDKEYTSSRKMWDECGVSHLVSLVLQYVMWGLQHEVVSVGGVTMEWLDKARDGTPGAVFKVLAKMQMVKHCERLVSELPPGSRTKANLETVLSKFQGYAAYNEAFSTTSTGRADASTLGGEAEGADDADASTLGGEAECAEPDPYDELRKTLCKTGVAMLDFLYDWFAGDHDKDLEVLGQKHGGAAIGLLPWADMEGHAGTAWRDLSRQLGIHKSAVSLSDGGLPHASSRSLKRVLTEEGADEEDDRAKEMRQERAEAWKKAQLARKKYAVVTHADVRSAQDIQKWFEKQKAHQFVGKAGESHRVFVISGDTLGKEGPEPWKLTSEKTELSWFLEFMLRQTGPCDVILSFDGRNAADRSAMATNMQKARNLAELWVVFQSTKRLGRRVAWASDSREIGWISLPVPRTSLSVKERGDDTSAWAESTHDTVYSGVAPVPWDGLPLISAADKARVLGVRVSASTPDQSEVPSPPTKIFDTDRGMPLYWAERKPVEFWQDILWSLDAQQVVDLSPGSGSVGRACLRAGIQYVALCRTEAHAAWVGNVLDREGCELTVKNNSPLFEQDLASMLQKHFQEVLEQQEQQREAEEKEPEEDDGEA